MRKKGWVAKHN